MIFNIIGLIIGLMVLIAGIYYLVKEKNDKESRKIYGIITAVGSVIVIFIMIRIIFSII